MQTKAPVLNTKPSLPANRAFLVHFTANTDVETGPVSGRVEHVVSGETAHFASLQEVLAFVKRIFSSTMEKPP